MEKYELVKLHSWISENQKIWAFICDLYEESLTYGDYIEMLETLVKNHDYLFAAILIEKANNNFYVSRARFNTGMGCTVAGLYEAHFFDELLDELKAIVDELDVLREEISL